jgi:hypothetical protein
MHNNSSKAATSFAEMQQQHSEKSGSNTNLQHQQQDSSMKRSSYPVDYSSRPFKLSTSSSANDKKWKESVVIMFQSARLICGKFVNHPKVQLLIVLLIAINAIMMGLATFDFVKNDLTVSRSFEITDLVFLVIFTIELAMQFFYHGWRLFTNGWLCFDFVIITMSWAFAEFQIIRAFRAFRALRLISRIKVLQNLVTGKSVEERHGKIALAQARLMRFLTRCRFCHHMYCSFSSI